MRDDAKRGLWGQGQAKRARLGQARRRGNADEYHDASDSEGKKQKGERVQVRNMVSESR